MIFFLFFVRWCNSYRNHIDHGWYLRNIQSACPVMLVFIDLCGVSGCLIKEKGLQSHPKYKV